MCKNRASVCGVDDRGTAVERARGSVGIVDDSAAAQRVAAATRSGSETLGEWTDRHELTRDQVAARLTKELGKPISAKAIVLYRNRPAPRSWREALAKSEHAPHEVGRQPAPQGRTREGREGAATNGSHPTQRTPSLYASRPARRWPVRSPRRPHFLMSDNFWWLLLASALGLLIGLVVALTVSGLGTNGP
jgi:hypothetical protein